MIYGDFLLIMNQFLGIYQCYNDLLNLYKKEVINLLKHFKTYKIKFAPRSLIHFDDTMPCLGSLISTNPHWYIWQMEIVTLNESYLKMSPSLPLVEASINKILIKFWDLWYKQLHEYLKWNVFPIDMDPIEKCVFKHRTTHHVVLGNILYK